jgi:hypothetical protein
MSEEPDDGEATRSIISPRSILLVSAPTDIAKRCRAAAARAKVLFAYECDLATLTNMAAERKPLAIIFPEHIYDFDSAEFDALARDIQATIVALEPGLSDDELVARLDDAFLRAELLRQPEASSGRYAVVPETHRRPKRR